MVHGGLRYLSQGDIKLTRHSLRERERLLKEAPGLIKRMGYYFTLRKGQFPGRLAMAIVLSIYDRLAGIKDHYHIDSSTLAKQFPGINQQNLKGASYYTDTVVDDARLVLRVLQEAIQAGGHALNYVKAIKLIKDPSTTKPGDSQVCGVIVENTETDEQLALHAPVVINATGAWADCLRREVVDEKRIRPLRGSHLVFSRRQLAVEGALALLHPDDNRPVFVFPWEGVTVVGTTDVDHNESLHTEASITNKEIDYLLKITGLYFPDNKLGRKDVISSYSGVRPVIGSDKSRDPSRERRDYAVWADKGLITVSGGKLTTFRLTAIDTLNAAQPWLKKTGVNESDQQVFSRADTHEHESEDSWLNRLNGRYGNNAAHLLARSDKTELELIADTKFCLAECRWALKHESVIHLDDLLLRRTRLGLIIKNGAEVLFPDLKNICQQELGWDAERWESELLRYRDIWRQHYSLPTL